MIFWLFTLFTIFIYFWFRSGIYEYLRLSKMSKTYIRKNRKGVINYWFYTQIHKQRPLGYLYHLNAIFLILILLHLFFTIVFEIFGFGKLVVLFLTVVLCIVELPATIASARYDALAEYGVSFVLLAKRKENVGYYSSITDYLLFAISVFLTIMCIKVYIG